MSRKNYFVILVDSIDRSIAQKTYFARGHPFLNLSLSFDPSSNLQIFENLLPVGGNVGAVDLFREFESESHPNRIIRTIG